MYARIHPVLSLHGRTRNILSKATTGAPRPKARELSRFCYGSTATTHPVISQRSGINSTPFSGRQRGFLVPCHNVSTTSISSPLRTRHHRLRCSTGLLNSSSKFCLNLTMGLTDRNDCLFREGQRDGIWAYDITQKERVLVIPAVLALLGDNPMQSELSCHVGLAGKFFCRCCWVKGRDAEDEVADKTTEKTTPHVTDSTTGTSTSTTAGSTSPSPAHSTAANSNASSGSSVRSDSPATPNAASSKKKGRAQETKQQLVERATRFLGVSISLFNTDF